METLISDLINLRQNIRHPSESYVHASAVFKDSNNSYRQCL